MTPDPSKLPAHVAIIMDGNGRWARQRGKPVKFGHRHGAEAARSVVEACVGATSPTLPCLHSAVRTGCVRLLKLTASWRCFVSSQAK